MKNKKLKLSTILRANQAFSLVEVIVAMAVLLLILIAFTTLFTFAFGGIFYQGRKSEALYEEVQKELEDKYEQGHAGGTDTLAIDFSDADITNPSVSGEIVTETYTYEDQSGTRTRNIYTFIPGDQ